VSIQPPPTNTLDGCTAVYEQLLGAISARRSVRICYNSLAERKTLLTRLNPYRLLFSQRSWYVIGRSSVHRGTRTFNLGRITSLDLLDDAFRIPRGFSLNRYLGNAWRLIPEPGPDHEVHVRFAPLVAANVAEVAWHKTQRVLKNADGTLDFHVTVSGLHEISWWILGYGDQAVVVQPPELRRLVAARAFRMADCYAADLLPSGPLSAGRTPLSAESPE
jgi:proteasome accessory factor B